MPKHPQPEQRRRREPSLRRVRQPWHLGELEAAAQTDVDAGDPSDAGRPLDDEAHRGIAFGTSDGALSGRDPDQGAVVDAGLSIDPEDLGRQFLRDATEQDNFESEFAAEPPTIPDSPPIAELISESTLEAAGQDETELPASTALDHRGEEQRGERFAEDVDLLSNVIHEASLFDRATEQDETLAPRVESDETEPGASDPEARTREQERERRALRRLRLSRRGPAPRRRG